jgi:TolB protein
MKIGSILTISSQKQRTKCLNCDGSVPAAIKTLFALGFFFALAGCSPSRISPEDMGPIYARIDVAPQGDRIVFSAEGNGGKDLFLLNLKSHAVARLTDTSDYENYPAFSPDGKDIVFQRAKTLSSPRYLFVMNLATRRTRQITADSYSCDTFPRYSQDGKEIVFERDVTFCETENEESWADSDLCTIKPDGAGLRRITCAKYQADLHPSTHSVGSDIIFDLDVQKAGFTDTLTIVKTGQAGTCSAVSRAADATGYLGGFPYLLADGKHLAYTSDHDGDCRYDIYIADLTKATPPICVHALKCGEQIEDPVVTADGKHIFFIVGYSSELWEIDSDGTGAHRIADDSLFSHPMSWKWKP